MRVLYVCEKQKLRVVFVFRVKDNEMRSFLKENARTIFDNRFIYKLFLCNA